VHAAPLTESATHLSSTSATGGQDDDWCLCRKNACCNKGVLRLKIHSEWNQGGKASLLPCTSKCCLFSFNIPEDRTCPTLISASFRQGWQEILAPEFCHYEEQNQKPLYWYIFATWMNVYSVASTTCSSCSRKHDLYRQYGPCFIVTFLCNMITSQISLSFIILYHKTKCISQMYLDLLYEYNRPTINVSEHLVRTVQINLLFLDWLSWHCSFFLASSKSFWTKTNRTSLLRSYS